ncbi:MAG: hypothetical protein EHM23_10425 [Acidobacteria bacterium]|nr:MAG: hypothetical protein EHM23_10425 [Acidobacteriota bacterium]
MSKKTLLGLSLLGFSCLLQAQSQEDLKDYFEGKQVIVKIDMPGDKSGIDLRLDDARVIDFSEVGRRTKRYGVSIRRGDEVMITLVKVNKKNIEFQLGGGGYGTAGDPVSTPSVSTYVPKSEREKRLEDDVRNEKDPRQKKRLQDQLDDLRREREREEARLKAEAAQAEILAEAQERNLRRTSGSRFNLWFADRVPAEALTPGAVNAALADYVDFNTEDSRGRDQDKYHSSVDPGASRTFVLRKGVTEQEVNRAYGQPISRNLEQLKTFSLVTATYATEDGELLAHFVEGVLVKYSMSSK